MAGALLAAVYFDSGRDLPGLTPERREDVGLSPCQGEFALLLTERLSNKENARRFEVRPNTARRHCEQVFQRLGVHSRQEVAGVLRREAEGRSLGDGQSPG